MSACARARPKAFFRILDVRPEEHLEQMCTPRSPLYPPEAGQRDDPWVHMRSRRSPAKGFAMGRPGGMCIKVSRTRMSGSKASTCPAGTNTSNSMRASRAMMPTFRKACAPSTCGPPAPWSGISSRQVETLRHPSNKTPADRQHFFSVHSCLKL